MARFFLDISTRDGDAKQCLVQRIFLVYVFEEAVFPRCGPKALHIHSTSILRSSDLISLKDLLLDAHVWIFTIVYKRVELYLYVCV